MTLPRPIATLSADGEPPRDPLHGSDEAKLRALAAAQVAEAVAKERGRIAAEIAAQIGVIDGGCPSCVSTACEIIGNAIGVEMKIAKDEAGNEIYAEDDDEEEFKPSRLLITIRVGKEEG